MSLRDFNNAPFSDDPTALHTAPSGNGAGLKSFHTTQPEDIEPNNMPKIVGAVAVALMIGVAGELCAALNEIKNDEGEYLSGADMIGSIYTMAAMVVLAMESEGAPAKTIRQIIETAPQMIRGMIPPLKMMRDAGHKAGLSDTEGHA